MVLSLNSEIRLILVKKERNLYSWFISLRTVIYCIVITILLLCYFIFNCSKTATAAVSFQ